MSEQQNVERVAQQAAQRILALIQSDRADAGSYLANVREELSSSLTEQVNQSQEEMKTEVIGLVRRGIAKLGTVAEANAEQAAEQITLMRQMIERAEAAAEEARQATAAAEKAKAEAEQAREAAEAERIAAEKATAVLTLKGSLEIERMVKASEFKAREKATREALKNELAAMEDRYDLLMAEVDNGIQQYYPRMREEMERLAEEEGDQDEGADE